MRYQRRHEPDTPHIALALLSAALVAAGITLRAWQYLGRRALWTDEATRANNLVGRSFGRLMFTPLGHNQAAPVGFLLIEKLLTALFGANELALRAFPLACRGRERTWVLFAHELPRLRERALMLGYLNRIGHVRDSVVVPGRDVDGTPTSVSLYLYDLSDAVTLASASARSFSIGTQPSIEERLRSQSEN